MFEQTFNLFFVLTKIQKENRPANMNLPLFYRVSFGCSCFIGLMGVVMYPLFERIAESVERPELIENIQEARLKSYVNRRGLTSFVLEFPYQTPSQDSEIDLDTVTSDYDFEALKSLEAALEMLSMGKMEKAQKLFEHALALAPKNPDILNHYGEFLEKTKNDLLNADHLYFKALTNSPGHSRAVLNHNRIVQVVEELDIQILKRIDKKRGIVKSIPENNSALRKAKLEAYFQHIYHTVGIEGNTMTLSQTRSVVETKMAVAGKSIIEHNEILGLDAALKYINTTLINRIGHITVEDILGIHKRVLGFVDPIEGGTLRRTQVFVGGHIPPEPSSIPPLMQEFETWLNSWEALQLHPVEYAALAHYKLVYLHPFNDGNGRTSRLLMNTILMQAGYPPVIILKQDRQRYYRTIEIANEGDIRPFIRFIAECTEHTLDLFIWSTSEFSSELPAIASKMIKEDRTDTKGNYYFDKRYTTV